MAPKRRTKVVQRSAVKTKVVREVSTTTLLVADDSTATPGGTDVDVVSASTGVVQVQVEEVPSSDGGTTKGRGGRKKEKEAPPPPESEETQDPNEDDTKQRVVVVTNGHAAPPEEATPAPGKKKKKKKRKGAAAGKAAKGRRGRRDGGGYKRYVWRVLKQVHPELGVSGRTMAVLDTMMADMFERLAEEAARLSKLNGRATLTSREVQSAVRLVLPGELGKHAISEGTKAVAKFMSASSA